MATTVSETHAHGLVDLRCELDTRFAKNHGQTVEPA